VSSKPKKRRGLRKPCSVCGRWFVADARVGARQKTCSEECRRALKVSHRATFAKNNPHYWRERRLDAKIERIAGKQSPPELGTRPPALRQMPGAYVLSKMGTEALVILGELGRVLLAGAQSEMEVQVLRLKEEFGEVLRAEPQSEIAAVSSRS